jgi:hypothetical protein
MEKRSEEVQGTLDVKIIHQYQQQTSIEDNGSKVRMEISGKLIEIEIFF